MKKIIGLTFFIFCVNICFGQVDFFTSTNFFSVEIRDKAYYDRLDARAKQIYDQQLSYVTEGQKAYAEKDWETVKFYGNKIKDKSLWNYRFIFICVGAYKLKDRHEYKSRIKEAEEKIPPPVVRFIKSEIKIQ